MTVEIGRRAPFVIVVIAPWTVHRSLVFFVCAGLLDLSSECGGDTQQIVHLCDILRGVDGVAGTWDTENEVNQKLTLRFYRATTVSGVITGGPGGNAKVLA
jgi:hypothetical protein